MATVKYPKLYKHLLRFYNEVASEVWKVPNAEATAERYAKYIYTRCSRLITSNLKTEDQIISSYPLA